MKESDIEHLEWIYDRIINVDGFRSNVDWVSKFKSIIDSLKPKKKGPVSVESKEGTRTHSILENAYVNRMEVLSSTMGACPMPYDRFTVTGMSHVGKNKSEFIIKPAMKETNRARVEIPENVHRDYMHGYSKIHNGVKVEVIAEFSADAMLVECEGKRYDIPKSWLVEIKEESRPCTAEEFVEWNCTANEGIFKPWKDDERFKSVMEQAFKEGEKKEALKHRETETFGKWLRRAHGNYHPNRSEFTIVDLEGAWYACNKSRGYE